MRYRIVNEYYGYAWSNNSLSHHGILGQKWGVRRYQNKDGSLTAAGKKRYSKELKNLAKKYSANPVHEDYEVQEKLVSNTARDFVKPTWNKQKIASARDAALNAYKKLVQAHDELNEQMMNDEAWRKREATKIAEEHAEYDKMHQKFKSNEDFDKYKKEEFDYYYNVEGLDAASEMYGKYYETMVDSRTKKRVAELTQQHRDLEYEYVSLMSKEVKKVVKQFGINNINTDLKTRNDVKALVRSVINLDLDDAPRYVAPDGFWAGDSYITNSSLKKGYNEYLSIWDTPEARSAFGTKKLTEQEFMEELKKAKR